MLLWAQTGVAQTDYRVERYNALNGLEHAHWVNDVQMDSTGMIWVVLNQGGLARFDGDVFTYYSLPPEWQKDFRELVMQKLVIDRRGKFWVNGLGKILDFDPAAGKFTIPDDVGGLPNSNIAALRQTRSGALTFFSNDNLYYRRLDDNRFRLAGHITLPKEFSIETTDTEENERGELWIATQNGFYRHVQGNPELEFTGFARTEGNPFPTGSQASVRLFDSPANVQWYSDALQRVIKINTRSENVEQYKMPEFKHLFSVLETGDLRWFGVFDGLIKVSRRNQFFQRWLDQPFDLSQGPPTGNSCYGLTETPDGFIYTASDLSLYEISPLQPVKSRQVQGMPVNFRRYGMMTDQNGNIWLSRYGYNVDCYNPKTHAMRRVPYDVSNGLSNSLLQDKTGLIWVACENGIVRIDLRTFTASTFPLPEKTYVWHFHQSDDHTIWAATKNGILKINPASGEVRQFNSANTPGMASGEILSIHEAEGLLWCGSTGGLIRFNPRTNAAVTFSTRHGLPHNHVYAAIPAEGSLWLPTNKGLARVSLTSLKKPDADLADVDIFGADDGLPHHEFNTLTFLKAKNGTIWLGGLNGVVAFDPKKLVLGKSADKSVIIAEFSKYDQKADSVLSFPLFKDRLPDAFVLRPEEKFFSVRFALLDYRDPKANQYSYKLEGFDPDWVFAGNQNTARYANLPPGRYSLRIRGANPNGIWSNREATAIIVVQQVWYKTAWAWLLYALFAAGLIYGAWSSRVRRLRLAQQLELEHLRSRSLKDLEVFKSRFFTNITHEFRTPLTVVLGMTGQLRAALEAAGRKGAPPDIPVLLSQATLVQRSGENLLRLVNQILDLAKLESNSLKINYIQGNVVAFVRYISESLHSLAETRNIRLDVKSAATEIVLDYDPERLQQIVYNLLSNAIKFTPEGGRVLLTLDFPGFENQESLLVIRVTDTGHGIPPEALPFVFDRFFQADNQEYAGASGSGIGLSLTKELVKAMGGEISVESTVGVGSTFWVKLPITKNAVSDGVTQIHPVTTTHRDGVTSSHPVTAPTLLLIEDNPDVMEFLAACLRDRYALDFAYDGEAGITKALETVPDLIISDVMMPGKNGFEVCETLKNDERSSHIPLVLLTAKADMDSRLAGLRRGADAYLAKPFHSEELLLTLNNLLELRRQMQARYLDWATREIPVSETDSTAADPENEFLQKLRAIVEENLSDANLDVEALCRKIGMSRTNLHNKLTALTGLSTTLYVRKLRLRRAKELLAASDATVAEIAYEVGFNDPKFFSRVYAEEYGVPPSEARKKF